MKVLVYFPRKKVDIFFEGAMLENIIKRACRNNEVTIIDKINKDVDIANFINLNAASTLAIRNAIGLSVPTLLWMFWANNDSQARIIEVKKDGSEYIPNSRLDVINMMDGVVVPTNEGRLILRKLGVKIPVFVIPGAVGVSRLDEIKTNKLDIFRRYFRIADDQKYTISVMNVRARHEIEQLNVLAGMMPEYNFYALISAGSSTFEKLRLRALNKLTSKNLIISELVPEDVYRSGLIGASFFINLGFEKMNVMTLYEPMYLKVPLIMNKKSVFSEIINSEKAVLVNNAEEAAMAMDGKDFAKLSEQSYAYTQKVNQDSFMEAIMNLFNKIYTRLLK